MWQEFKQFAMKGNVIDLAVGIIIGAAFNKIVSSLVNDIVMPLIGLIVGKIDVAGLVIGIGEVQIKIGMFIQNIIDFLIIAFSVFLIIKAINKLSGLRKSEEKMEEAVKLTKEEMLLAEIRDILKYTK